MAKLSVNAIRERPKQIVLQTPEGIRYSELVTRISREHPETPKNTIHGSVWDLAERFPDLVHRPSRGLYVALDGNTQPPVIPDEELEHAPSEAQFYQPFADWLKNELDEATIALPLGGAGFRKKWGTPDVIGVYKPLASHRIKFDLEIVSAEVKVDPQQPVVAFGQAAAYRLFSAKSACLPKTTADLASDSCSSSQVQTIRDFRFASGHSDSRRTCSTSMNSPNGCFNSTPAYSISSSAEHPSNRWIPGT